LPREEIVALGAARAFVLRERTIPLIPLAEALGAACGPDDGADAHVVVAACGGEIVGLQVDQLGQRMEVMLKPMEGLLAGTPGVGGATLLGDGRVLIVLDVHALLA
jgi:two-component system chemotaxis sensor kinase CheA